MTGAPAATADRKALFLWLFAASVALALLGPLLKAWGMATDLGHGWAAPLLIAYLYWERWDERPVAIAYERMPVLAWSGLVLVVLMLGPLRLFVTPFPLWPALVWCYVAILTALALGVAGIVGGGAGIRWIGGPLLILAGTLPWPHQIDTHLVQPLRVALAAVAADLINLTGQPALASGTTVRFAAGYVGVDEACGGIRSLQASVMMALFFGEWLRLAWTRRLALIGVGIAAALLGNFLRILFLAWRATVSEAAVASAHDLAGWMALALSLTLTGALAWWWHRNPGETPVAVKPGVRVVRPPLAPALARFGAIAAASLLVIEAANYAWYQHGARRRESVAQWTIQLPVEHRTFKENPLPDASRDILRPDFYTAGTWQADRERFAGAYYVEWRKGQAARFVPVQHNPANCLPYTGCELVEPLEEISVPWAGGVIPFQTFLFRRASERFIVGFAVWDPLRGEPLSQRTSSAGRWGWIRTQWQDVVEARKDQPGQMLTVSLIGARTSAELQQVIKTLIVAKRDTGAEPGL